MCGILRRYEHNKTPLRMMKATERWREVFSIVNCARDKNQMNIFPHQQMCKYLFWSRMKNALSNPYYVG